MAGRVVWDAQGAHYYETGVKNCVLYPVGTGQTPYVNGVAWNGITSITESPSGAESTPLYADDTKYLDLLSAEDFGATIEAYTYPDEFAILDGSADLVQGARVGQQDRGTFGLCYKTTLGNDTQGNSLGYKLHIIYGAKATPSEKAYSTINDSPEAVTFSWTINTTPVNVTGFKPTSQIIIDSTKANATKLAALEDILYGKDAAEGQQAVEPRLPLPDEVKSTLTPPTGNNE